MGAEIKMKPPYNFGLSQEDVITEIKALGLADGDSLLCIAGAGELPLNVAGLRNCEIVAVDSSENQLRLCRLKQMAAARLGPYGAEGFLGYIPLRAARREQIFKQELVPFMEKEDMIFWQTNQEFIMKGVVHCGKFEQFMAKASRPARWVIGKKNLYRLFECNSPAEQEAIFDRDIAGILLKQVFKTAFHPQIYKNRGIDAAGMQHRKDENIGNFFFNRFRSFCCSTPARSNFLLQYVFFQQSLFPEALPEYLKKENQETFARNSPNIRFVRTTIENFITDTAYGQFNKIQLSNIGDWMPVEVMERLFSQVQQKTMPGSRLVLRYIYLEPSMGSGAPFLKKERPLGEELIKTDRFPFSSAVPVLHVSHEGHGLPATPYTLKT